MDKKRYLIFLGLILIGVALGGIGVWFLKDMVVRMSISADAKTAARHVTVTVVDNGFQFMFDPDTSACRVAFWQSGGVALDVPGGQTWMNVTWQLDLTAEDKPTTTGQGDYLDVILKICKWTDGSITYTVLCAGDYVKRVYYDTVLELSSSTSRYGQWTVPAA